MNFRAEFVATLLHFLKYKRFPYRIRKSRGKIALDDITALHAPILAQKEEAQRLQMAASEECARPKKRQQRTTRLLV